MISIVARMKWYGSIFVFLVVFIAASERELVIEDDGYGNIRLGKTKMSTIKKNNPFAKKKKTIRHALFRDPRICVMITHEQISKRNGITYFFGYRSGDKDSVTVSEIMFELPLRARLHNGIRLGESTFKDVEEIYGVEDNLVNEQVSKHYDKIEFYSHRMIGKDSIDENFVVTGFKLTRW